jgi:signal peptidase I
VRDVLLLGFGVLAVVACARTGFTAGDSMLPSIAVGAKVATDELERAPARGDVIVFRSPEKPDQRYVKRIVGLAGDTIAADGAVIVLNGTPIPHCRVGAWGYREAGGEARQGEIWLEALDGRKWLVFHDARGIKVPPPGPWTVAPGEVFVLADNRENGHDSRFWFGGKGGGLPLHWIVGAATDTRLPALPSGAEALQPALDACVATLSR